MVFGRLHLVAGPAGASRTQGDCGLTGMCCIKGLKMKKLIWISYDLGVKGDYEGLYAWLDNHDAKECGNSLATLEYEYTNQLVEEIQKDLSQSISLARHDRVYMIWREDRRMKGKFLFGKRKAAPWSGYGPQESQVDEEVQ